MELDMVTDMDVDKVATMLANNKKKAQNVLKAVLCEVYLTCVF